MMRQDDIMEHEEATRLEETGLDGNEISPPITEGVGDPSDLDGLLRRTKSPELVPATVAPHPAYDLKDIRESGDYKLAMLEDAVARLTSFDHGGRRGAKKRVDRATQVNNNDE